MDAKNLNELSVRERMLIEQVRANPGLGEKLHALMASARAEQLGEASADEAEERIVEQMRALGLEALQGWSEQRERSVGEQMQAMDAKARVRAKKNSAGTARLGK